MTDPKTAIEDAARAYAELKNQVEFSKHAAQIAQDQSRDLLVRNEELQRQIDKLQSERDFYYGHTVELTTGARAALSALSAVISGVIPPQPKHNNVDPLADLERIIRTPEPQANNEEPRQ